MGCEVEGEGSKLRVDRCFYLNGMWDFVVMGQGSEWSGLGGGILDWV